MGVQGRTPKDKPFGDHKHCWKIRITRSGCVYVPPEVERGPSAVFKGKGKTTEYVEEEVDEGLPDGVTNEEACEFLKIIKQSQYRVVDQLNKTPTRISLLSLLMNSEAHRNVLLKVWNRAHASHDISTDKLGTSGALSFSLDSPLAERTENHQALATGTSYNPHTSEHSEWLTKVCVFFFTMKPVGVFFGLD
ncbi:hypothetical protein Lal_00042062 [Lupinus albus]|nr:hypothetical protein Lal_00042062 [Lupinus albus]